MYTGTTFYSSGQFYSLLCESLTNLGGWQGVGRLISNRMSYRNHYMCSGEATSRYERKEIQIGNAYVHICNRFKSYDENWRFSFRLQRVPTSRCQIESKFSKEEPLILKFIMDKTGLFYMSTAFHSRITRQNRSENERASPRVQK